MMTLYGMCCFVRPAIDHCQFADDTVIIPSTSCPRDRKNLSDILVDQVNHFHDILRNNGMHQGLQHWPTLYYEKKEIKDSEKRALIARFQVQLIRASFSFALFLLTL